jgi:pimeloyl-ACP methyl ester carboxylesterase
MSVDVSGHGYESHYVAVGNHTLHYLDEGKGETILFVHGIPEWSYLYSKVIRELSPSYRCIVPDHLGFGLSEKPATATLTPAAHATRLYEFICALSLKDIHIVLHDYGGPIGAGVITAHPELFRSITISNSWCWDVSVHKSGKVLKLMQGALGRWLYLRYGFSVKFMAKNGFARKQDYAAVKEVLLQVHRTKEERLANYILMLEMLRSGPWFDQTLQQLKQLTIPTQLLWGTKDRFFNVEDYLKRWQQELPQSAVTTIPCGHFPHIEAPEDFAAGIRAFISRQNC